MLENKRILITGVGSIGSELYRQLVVGNTLMSMDIDETSLFDLHEEHRLKGFDVHYRLGDVRDKDVVKDVFASFKPEIVFHAAALKHVTPNEAYPREALRTNAEGTLNVVGAAKANGVEKLIYISTDKVINSCSIMGVTKKFGELVAKNAGYTAVRFGNVLGSRGSVLPIWQKQISEDEPLTITDNRMERFFMTIEEACELVIRACEISSGGEIMIMDMGQRKNMLELAKEILLKLGKPNHPIRMIGLRPGETLVEEFMTPEERQRALKLEKFYIIR